MSHEVGCMIHVLGSINTVCWCCGGLTLTISGGGGGGGRGKA